MIAINSISDKQILRHKIQRSYKIHQPIMHKKNCKTHTRHRAQTYKTNLLILLKTGKGPILNTLKQLKIYKRHKKNKIMRFLNDQIACDYHILYDIAIQ